MANSDANVLQTVIQLRRGTEEQWNLVKDTFIPREGEPCTTIYDDGRDALIKIGDGKHTWGQLGYTKDSFFITASQSDSGEIVPDKTFEETVKAIKQNKMVYVKVVQTSYGTTDTIFLPFLTFEGEGGNDESIGFGYVIGRYSTLCIFKQDGTMVFEGDDYLVTDESQNFNANNRQIVNLQDSEDLKSATTKRYTDNSTPTFIYLEEQNDVIQSKTTDLETLKTALMSQTDGYTQTNKPLYKAIKCYAVLNGNCYDLIYSSQETQGAGKKDIVKRTFYAITTDGLNKLSVVIDENQTDENKKVVWTKEAQGIASEQFIVTLTNVDGIETWESDKTPAEIATEAQAGKQIVLKRQWEGKTETAYLVSVTDERADFCFIGTSTDIDYDTDNSDILKQEWVTITADKAAKIYREIHAPFFIIQENGPDWVSTLSPLDFIRTGFFGPASNAYLNLKKDGILGGVFINTFDEENNTVIHVYFPDYANNKVYDLKYNGDENPSTYTFTELTLDEKPMIVNFTVTDPTTFNCTADKTYEEVDSAYKKGIPIYGKVALGSQQGFLSCSHEISGSYNFTGLATKSNFTMAITYDLTGCYVYLGRIMWKNFVGNDETWDANNSRIESLGSPIDNSDAATKGYVDNILTAGNSDSVVIKSSTPNSIKKFRITVDDAGAISATEVVS